MNHSIQKLYEMSKSTDNNGLTKFDEQKLRRELEGNKSMFARNKDTFAEHEPRFHTCKSYLPCPICDKCLNKASHLYIKCQNCKIPMCIHTYDNRKLMIRRKNFEIRVNKKTLIAIRKIANKIIGGDDDA